VKRVSHNNHRAEDLVDRRAERAVLGCCLLDPDAAYEALLLLRVDDFSLHAHRLIFQAIADIVAAGHPPDVTMVASKLESRGVAEEAGGLAYLADLAAQAPVPVHVRHYASVVLDRARRRSLVMALERSAACAFDDDVSDPVALCLTELVRLRERTDKKVVSPEESLSRWLELMSDREQRGGVVTGFRDLDRLLGGLRPGGVVVVGGRPGTGKTTFVECVAERAAVAGKAVLFVSLEMSAAELFERRIVRASGLEWSSVASGRARPSERLLRELRQQPIWYLEQAQATTHDITLAALKLKAQRGLALIVVDYLQLLGDQEGSTETERVTAISRRLKGLARELHVPVLAVSQLSRGPEHREDKRPNLGDLRQSGSIEQDADAVLLLYRERYYNPECGHDIAEVNVAKNRVGPTGICRVLFDPGRFAFFDVASS